MPTVAGRRTYTEDELQAALRDIQSGKLGTRRAAVIYGIPRSTLRNKVYKLALERERESHNPTVLKIDEDEVIEDEKELSGAEEEKEVEKTLKGPLLTFTDIMRLTNMEPEMLKTILQRNKEGTSEPWSGEIASYIQTLLLASQKPPEGGILTQADFVKRMMAEDHLMKMQKVNGDSERLRPNVAADTVITKVDKPRSEPDMDTESESSSNVILKIPSFKPTTSKNGSDLLFRGIEGTMVSPPITTSESNSPPIIPNKLSIKDVKDVIAQSISQKFQQPAVDQVRRPIMEMDFKGGSFTPPLASSISVIKTNPQEISRVYQQQTPPKPQQNSGGQTTGGKGTRPKRGKYRNYDRDSLVEAVRAVQRGEMSVHRAGSYYGVPHSTLEYKVKERHLMRPRKRDPKPNPVDEKIASLKQNDIRNAQDKLKPVVMKPPQKFPPTSPNGMKLPIFESAGMSPLPGYNAPPFPFWPHPGFHHIPLEYARNPSTSFPTTPEFFASQMMQKLQEETSRSLGANSAAAAQTAAGTPTLAKSARQMAESLLDGTGSNGSFLDGIIRSSLESGVPTPNDEKLKEERNVAPEKMSNKALIDQLCINSRLTPLTRPPNSDASSGDESYRKGNCSPLNFAASVKEEKMDDSPPPYEKEHPDGHGHDLSNDSQESLEKKPQLSQMKTEANVKPPGRIYLKPDLVNPDNLKPEMLVRFIPNMDRNGICENPDSASENEAPQD